MKNNNSNIIVFDIKDIYHEIGKYNFKILFNKKFKNCNNATVEIIDSNNNNYNIETLYWGRKINCSFELSKESPSGVYALRIKMKNEVELVVNEVINFWVIK